MAQKKKMGRPPIGDKTMRDRIFVLVSDETKEQLQKCTEAYHTTRSDIVRQGIKRIYDDLEK